MEACEFVWAGQKNVADPSLVTVNIVSRTYVARVARERSAAVSSTSF